MSVDLELESWRQQWQSLPLVEGRFAVSGGSPRTAHPCVPLSAGNQQMEQNRASHVLSHHSELARPAFSEPRSHRQSDCEYNNTHGLED